MNRPSSALFALYCRGLRLYPSDLRARYKDQIIQTVRDAHAERTGNAPIFWLNLFADLFLSSFKERLLMIRNRVLARPIFFYTLCLAILLTLWGFPAALTLQGALRGAADEPQIQMAQNDASQIAAGQFPADLIPPGHVDPSSSLEPFSIFYGADGSPLRSSGYIGDSVPTPPPGVFAYLRTHLTDKFTWQPQPGIRIAAFAQRVDGPDPGFILVGRSLALVQQQENRLRLGTFLSWSFLMALLIAGAYLLNRFQGATPRSATYPDLPTGT